ncbi:MAG TPA: VOC family protein, partial [Pseudonocardiaceae bacterium]|nr:VOC family protein [Pseudonocardiaceae bacterium]
MTDPLDALRSGYRPVVPDAAFAARLRTRLELAVLGQSGAKMSTEAKAVTVDSGSPHDGDLAYSSVWLPDVARGAAFYAAALGWRVEPGREPRSRRISGVTPPMGMWGDVADGTLFLCHAVDDVHAAVARVRAAGGSSDEPVQEPFGLLANCVDNQGTQFALLDAPLAGRQPLPTPGAGGLLYLTVQVPDSALYRDFYGTVFGWTFTPGRVEDGWNVHGVTPMTGLSGG